MTQTTTEQRGRATCTLEITPTEVRAGAPLTVRAAVTSIDARDLRGFACNLERADGSIACRFELAVYGGAANQANEVEIEAPIDVGEHVFTMVFPQQAKGGVVFEEARAEATVTVEPHPVQVTVWGLPAPATTGAPFTVVVGGKGGSPTSTAGKPFVVRDASGAVAAEGVLGSEPWRGTDALHAGEATLHAPAAPGVHRWTAHISEFDDPLPHLAGERAFTITAVEPPSHEVTVTVLDHETRAPVAGAQVVMHPFHAHTDADGVARVKVTPGDHRVFVSGYDYVTFRTGVTVEDDLSLEAELVREVQEDPGDLYV
jgi:hypothetical protein